MKKNRLKESWQIQWISVGLFFIIPITVHLGIEFIYSLGLITDQTLYPIILNSIIVTLSIISTVITSGHIRTSFVSSIVLLALSNYWDTTFNKKLYLSIPIEIITIISFSIALICILYMAHRDQDL